MTRRRITDIGMSATDNQPKGLFFFVVLLSLGFTLGLVVITIGPN